MTVSRFILISTDDLILFLVMFNIPLSIYIDRYTPTHIHTHIYIIHYTMEVRNRLKGLDLIDRVLEKL